MFNASKRCVNIANTTEPRSFQHLNRFPIHSRVFIRFDNMAPSFGNKKKKSRWNAESNSKRKHLIKKSPPLEEEGAQKKKNKINENGTINLRDLIRLFDK